MANIKGPKRSVAGDKAIVPKGSSGQASKQVSRSGGTSKKEPKRSVAGRPEIIRSGSYSQSNKQRGMITRGRKALGGAMGL